jgi:hypothetical protein
VEAAAGTDQPEVKAYSAYDDDPQTPPTPTPAKRSPADPAEVVATAAKNASEADAHYAFAMSMELGLEGAKGTRRHTADHAVCDMVSLPSSEDRISGLRGVISGLVQG